MEPWAVLLSALAFALFVVLPILSLIAYARSKRVPWLEEKLERLERELAQLRAAGASAPTAERAPAPSAASSAPPPASSAPPAASPVPGTTRTSEAGAPPAATPAATPATTPTAPLPREPLAPAPPSAPTLSAAASSAGLPLPSTPAPFPARSAPPPYPSQPSVAPSTASAKPASRAPRVDWERWIGLRGFAVLGGIALALAAILFFRHAFTQGWITPAMRVLLGLAAGLAAIVAGDRMRKGYRHSAAALAGAGAVALYAATWSAQRLYGFISLPVAFVALALVTALAIGLSLRHGSQLLAILALLGGFAAPLLLSSGRDQPLGLFGYTLLLDLALLFVAQRRGWRALGLLALLGTLLLQFLWIEHHLDPNELPFALAMLALFALLFAGTLGKAAGDRLGRAGQIVAYAIPFLFAVHFARRAELGEELLPLAVLASVLALGACVLHQLRGAPHLPLVAAAGAFGLFLAWMPNFDGAGDAMELARGALLVALAFHACVEWPRASEPARRAPVLRAASWMLLGLALLLAQSSHELHEPALPAYALGSLALGLLALRQSARGAWPWLAHATLVLTAIALGAHAAIASDETGAMGELSIRALRLALFASAALMIGAAALGRRGERSAALARAAGLHALVLAFHAAQLIELGSWIDAALPQALLALALLGATLSRSVALALASGLCAGVYAHAWVDALRGSSLDPQLLPGIAPALALGFAIALVQLAPSALARTTPAFGWGVVCALAPLVYALDALVRMHGHDALRAPVALALAGLTYAVARVARGAAEPTSAPEPPTAARTNARGALLTGLALGLALHAWPLLWGRSWEGFALAAWSLAACAVWARSASRTALVLGALLAFISLWPSEEDASSALRRAFSDGSGELLSSWGALAELVAAQLAAAALLVVGGALARPLERERARVARAGKPRWLARAWCSTIVSLSGLALAFLFVNASVTLLVPARSDGLDVQRVQLQDLVRSLAWALYALTLLLVGMRRALPGLRWVSLALFLITICKVFLLDLGQLEGLWRVGSLVGLACALLLVSMLYQRFVLRAKSSADAG